MVVMKMMVKCCCSLDCHHWSEEMMSDANGGDADAGDEGNDAHEDAGDDDQREHSSATSNSSHAVAVPAEKELD